MCEPTTIIAAAGLVFSVIGSMDAASAAKDTANYNAQVEANNKITSDRQSENAIRRGELDETRHRISVNQTKGAQRSALAAQGLDLQDGSALDTVLDTAEFGELDALIIRNNAENEAYGYTVQGNNSQNSANLYKNQASNISPLRAGVGTALTGAGKIAKGFSKTATTSTTSGGGGSFGVLMSDQNK